MMAPKRLDLRKKPDPEGERVSRAVMDAMLEHSTPVDPHDTTYGWIARDYEALRLHMAGCQLDYGRSAWAESDWDSWQDSFNPSVRKSGIDMHVWCRCGQVRGRTWRFSGGYAELIRALTGG